MPAHPARRASSLTVLLVTATGFVGGAGWTAGRTDSPEPSPAAASDTETPAPTPVAAGVDPHAGHHGHHAPPAAAPDRAPSHKHHDHDCAGGVCRCDSRCPTRRAGPCGGALRSCQGPADDSGVSPAPVRPFVLPPSVVLQPAFDRLERPDLAFVAATRALEPASPPPRTSSI